MGLLRLLGIEKYLKKVKTYVDEENVKDRAYTDKKVSENKAATPDWYAAEGQSGHIKNRTHCLNDYKGTLNANKTSVNLIGGEVIYAKHGNSIKELWEGDEWDIELWDESQGKLFAVKVTNTGLNVTLTGDVSHLTSNIGIYGRLEQIAEAYMPDTIARYSQIEELYNALEALTNRIEWHSVYEGDMKNMLDQNLTLSQMMQLGFSAVINNPYTIKGVIVEGDVNTTALAVSSIHSANGDVYGIEFGNISKHDTGAELILSKNEDGTWVITYIEA